MASVIQIRDGVVQIWCRCDDDGSGGVLAELRNLDDAYLPAKQGLGIIFDRVSKEGFEAVTAAMSHLIDERHHVYEFIKGDIRILYFKDGGTVVICAEALIKKTQKVDKNAKKRAIQFQKDYMEAKKAGQLRQIPLPRSVK